MFDDTGELSDIFKGHIARHLVRPRFLGAEHFLSNFGRSSTDPARCDGQSE